MKQKTPNTVEEFLKMWRDGYTEADRARDVLEAEAELRERVTSTSAASSGRAGGVRNASD
jgi:hypothetical protein